MAKKTIKDSRSIQLVWRGNNIYGALEDGIKVMKEENIVPIYMKHWFDKKERYWHLEFLCVPDSKNIEWIEEEI